MHTVLETSIFTRRADTLLSREEKTELIGILARNPQAGDVMPGCGGIRKLRFAPEGRGKSGAFRVIHYVLSDEVPVVGVIAEFVQKRTLSLTEP